MIICDPYVILYIVVIAEAMIRSWYGDFARQQ